ncbi:MAG: aminotransferase class V-fold PLP-dependent enzyme [Gemmatimonadetes bacterium]|nr:aminotransferase class V-fold PLP-dependent enzyme [Gemmatimonadota bacterium]
MAPPVGWWSLTKPQPDQWTGFNPGRQFLQLPGPTPVPESVMAAMTQPMVDPRGSAFSSLFHRVQHDLRKLFGGPDHVFLYPASASGAWEAALMNTMRRGDKVAVCINGYFAELWAETAQRMGFKVDKLKGDWRLPPDTVRLTEHLAEDKKNEIKAVMVVHNETSTGVMADISAVRRAMTETAHPALLMVDAVSSLGAVPFKQKTWGVDVAVCGSQKGLMLPPGLSFCAATRKAINKGPVSIRAYWNWDTHLEANQAGQLPYTPPIALMYGLAESLRRMEMEKLKNVFKRHDRLARATRHAVKKWGLQVYCKSEKAHSRAGTTVLVSEAADYLGMLTHAHWYLSLGSGLGKLHGRAFRIGHLGDVNELMLLGALSGVEMGLRACKIPEFKPGGVQAAISYLGKFAVAKTPRYTRRPLDDAFF